MSWIEIFINLSISYFIAVNTIYLILIIASVFSLKKQIKISPLSKSINSGLGAFSPSVSIIAPAYNEEQTVVESVRSFLMLDYPSYEVIVVNDGSKDQTLQKLIKAFELERCNLVSNSKLSDTEVIDCFKSKVHPKLTVINKKNGGKADSLNLGIGYCKYDLFCCVDSDSILESDALVKIAAPFLEQPEKVIASGGTIRIANGSKVKAGRIEQVDLPTNYWVLMQIIEYTRAFLCGRIGWNVLNSTLVISGAFGLFSRYAVIKVGGYKSGSMGEDMELVVRMHKYHRENKIPYSIMFVADPVCWTEAPAEMNQLKRQRDRWQRGLADTLMSHKTMFLNPKYGMLGIIAFPFYLFVELFGPLFEFLSFFIIGAAMISGNIDHNLLYSFFLASILYSSLMSISAVLIEEIYFSKYGKVNQFLTLFFLALVESFGYRQLTSFWKITGLWGYFRGNKSWGSLQRNGFNTGANLTNKPKLVSK